MKTTLLIMAAGICELPVIFPPKEKRTKIKTKNSIILRKMLNKFENVGTM